MTILRLIVVALGPTFAQLRPLLLWLTKRAVGNKPQNETLIAYLQSEVKRVIDTPELKRDIWMAMM
jgi:hypothetical protein